MRSDYARTHDDAFSFLSGKGGRRRRGDGARRMAIAKVLRNLRLSSRTWREDHHPTLAPTADAQCRHRLCGTRNPGNCSQLAPSRLGTGAYDSAHSDGPG